MTAIVEVGADHPALQTGDALEAFGLDTYETVIGALGQTSSEGTVIRTFQASGAEEPDAYLIAWPSRDCGLATLVQRAPSTGRLTLIGGWPFHPDGEAHAFIPEQILTDEGGYRAAVEGSIGDVAVTVFDTFCAATGSGWTGEPIPLRLGAWACALAPADITPDRIQLSALQPDVQAALGHVADTEGCLTFRKEGAAMMFSAAETRTPLYRIRGPVKSVSGPRELMGLKLWTLVVTIARMQDRQGGDLDIALGVTNAVWGESPPSPGQDVEGVVWLQAYFGSPPG